MFGWIVIGVTLFVAVVTTAFFSVETRAIREDLKRPGTNVGDWAPLANVLMVVMLIAVLSWGLLLVLLFLKWIL